MHSSDLEYDLPTELIAQRPAERREKSRLMVVDRKSQRLKHLYFEDLQESGTANDLFVLNNTRVFPARLFGRKEGMSRKIEVLLLRQVAKNVWEALVRPGRRVPPGSLLSFQAERFQAQVLAGPDASKRLLSFEYTGDFWSWIEKLGQVPLPPYIKRSGSELSDLDQERYQTVYAKQAGSVAAPTAGLHFTSSILENLHSCEITLHVGHGTFKPISAEKVEDHKMESEAYSVDRSAADCINDSMKSGRRIIAVGTTTTRTLEHVYLTHGRIVDGSDETDLFIYPGFKFGVIQGLLTNFHLPGSTLLALVCAFAGADLISRAYREAVLERYRFYSYGDAMLIL